MNRTQRAIRKAMRESVAENRTMKQASIYHRSCSRDTYLSDVKTRRNQEVAEFAAAEEKARRALIGYKQSVVREKTLRLKEEVRA